MKQSISLSVTLRVEVWGPAYADHTQVLRTHDRQPAAQDRAARRASAVRACHATVLESGRCGERRLAKRRHVARVRAAASSHLESGVPAGSATARWRPQEVRE